MKLTNKIEIIVPKHDNDGQVINNQDITQAIINITQSLGGCTVTENQGYWISNSGVLMIDKNFNYEWYFDTIDNNIIDNLTRIVHLLINEHGQECISIKNNGVLNIVDRAYKVSNIFDVTTV